MIDLAVAGTLLLTVALLSVNRFGMALSICAAQALLAACVLGQTLALPAALVIAFNGIAMPLALARFAAPGLMGQRVNGMLAWSAVGATSIAALALFGGLESGRVAAGAAVVLLGLLLPGIRSHGLAVSIGLLCSQNGLVLVACTGPDLRLLPAIAVAIPVSPALAMAVRWLPR